MRNEQIGMYLTQKCLSAKVLYWSGCWYQFSSFRKPFKTSEDLERFILPIELKLQADFKTCPKFSLCMFKHYVVDI